MEGRYNVRSPAVKRLMKEAQELSEPTDQYFAQPLEDNLFEWHFTVRGPADSDFQNGIYHGRIVLPVDYPMKPPSIIWLTPNGRFETNKKICLSISGHHPESWQPSWSIRTALLAIIGFMPTHGGGAIGSLDYKPEERKHLAKKSHSWKCPACNDVSNILLEVTSDSHKASQEAQELAAQINFQAEKPKSKTDENLTNNTKKGTEGENETDKVATSTSAISSESRPASDTAEVSVSTQSSSSPSTPVISNGAENINGSPLPSSAPSGPPLFHVPCSSPSSFGAPPSPWSHGPPFQMYGQYPSQGMPAMLPRFPYPPSFYTTAASFYPPGCAIPPGMGMFPFPPSSPLMPTYGAHNPISVNNSSAPSSLNSSQKAQTHTTSSSYTRTAMTCPSNMFPPQSAAATSADRSDTACSSEKTSPENRIGSIDNKHMLNELLSKVKRVGSNENGLEKKAEEKQETKEEKKAEETQETKAEETQDTKGEKKAEETQESQGGKCLQSFASKETTQIGLGRTAAEDQPHVGGENVGEALTDSDVSKSVKNLISAGDASNSEVLPSDTDNSEAGVPPIEVSESEQRSIMEKSVCNSTSELEKGKGKQPAAKGLRQRQSATASVNAEAGEDVPTDSPGVVTGQRIEAESGDVRPTRNVLRQGGHRLRATTQTTPATRSPFDVTFFLMVLCFISACAIFVNRVVGMYWGVEVEDFPTKPI